MAKTEKQVQSDIIALLQGSTLVQSLSGCVYRGTPSSSYRPRSSQKEDLIVIFTEGAPDEVETGTVTLNIYVPDIDPYDNGVLVEDGSRTAEIEQLADAWVSSLTCNRSNYRFKLRQSIYAERDAAINQHFVVVKLAYQYYGEQ